MFCALYLSEAVILFSIFWHFNFDEVNMEIIFFQVSTATGDHFLQNMSFLINVSCFSIWGNNRSCRHLASDQSLKSAV